MFVFLRASNVFRRHSNSFFLFDSCFINLKENSEYVELSLIIAILK